VTTHELSEPTPVPAVGLRRTLRRFTLGRYTGVLLGFAVVFVYLAMTEPVFLHWDNWQNIFRSQAVVFTLGSG